MNEEEKQLINMDRIRLNKFEIFNNKKMQLYYSSAQVLHWLWELRDKSFLESFIPSVFMSSSFSPGLVHFIPVLP